MASQSPHPTFSHQLPVHQFSQNFPYYDYNPNIGGQTHGYGHVPSSSTPNIDLYTRVAVLEKELEHCRVGKAEAEVAVQYLAILNAKESAHGGNGDKKVSSLIAKLSQANEESQALKAKLDNALAIITTLMTPSSIARKPQPHLAKERNLHKTPPFQNGDLIDLHAGTERSTSIKVADEDTITPDGLSVDLSKDEDPTQHTALGENPQESMLSPPAEFPDSSYIYHFAATTSGPKASEALATTAFKAITYGSRGIDMTATPSDQRSETSTEPRSDESSPEYSASIDGAASPATSFVTADVELPFKVEASAAVVPALDVQNLALQKWETVMSSPTEKAETSNVHFISKATTVSKQKDAKSAFLQTSLRPALKEPSWKVSKLFHSSTQRENTIVLHKREAGADEHCFPDLFKYGVRFDPDSNERDIYRTILVRDISAKTTMKELLENVRGGMVINAKLLDTQKLTGSNTALITFLHEHAALTYEEYVQTHPIVLNDRQAVVKVLPTPTYPMSTSLRRAIDDHQHTRCLEVHNFPRQILPAKLRADLRVCSCMNGDRLEHVEMRNDGVLELRFSAVDYAGQGFGMLTTFRLYKGCKTFFVPDPCAQPVETLLLESTAGPCTINIEELIKEANPEPESFTVDQSARLAKVEWGVDPITYRGRGFQTEDK